MKNPALLISIILCIITYAKTEIVNYPWPNSSDLKSDKYSVKIRELPSGTWQDVFTFNMIPRDYKTFKHGFPDSDFITSGNNLVHKICGSDHTTDFLKDRTMSFVQFAFTGEIEVEVKKLFGSAAPRVEIAPKAFDINPHYFDGKIVRFAMDRWRYVSVNFDCADNKDDDRYGGNNIRNGMMIFADEPEEVNGDYTIPSQNGSGVVVWNNSTDIETIRNANIIYFPPGDHKMKLHKDNNNNFITNKDNMLNEPLYHGQLRLKKSQKVYVAGGAVVRGCFRTNGHDNCWLYGRGVVSGRDHLMHEVLIPEIVNGEWQLKTQTKEAFVDYNGTDGANLHGVVITEAFHHTCPSGKSSVIKHIKILGYCSNNDGVRPGDNSVVEGIFIKTSDDYDYARSPHEVKDCVFWPSVNGAVGMLGWNDLGTGYAEYRNNYIINSEWSSVDKRNTGVIGSVANAGISLQRNVLENIYIENLTSYLVNATVEGSGVAGFLKDFTFKNIKVEYPFQLPNGTPCKQRMKGCANNPQTGFTFTNLVVDGNLVTWNNYKNHFDLNLTGSNGNNDDNAKNVHDVTFNSQGAVHKISVITGSGGNAFPKGENGVIDCPDGTSQTVSIIPDTGYRIKKVIVDGIEVQRIQVKHFNNVKKDHTLFVVFEQGDDYFDLSPTTINVNTYISAAYQFRIKPILHRSKVTVEYSLPGKRTGKIVLYTLSGKEITACSIYGSNGANRIDLVEFTVLASGVYTITLEVDRKRIMSRRFCFIQ